MHGNWNIGKAHGSLDEFFQVNRIGILACALGDLEHDRRLLFFTGLHNCLKQFHVVDVERADGVLPFKRLGEKFSSMGEWHRSVADQLAQIAYWAKGCK